MGELKGRQPQEPEGELLSPSRRPGLGTQTHVHTWKARSRGLTACVLWGAVGVALGYAAGVEGPGTPHGSPGPACPKGQVLPRVGLRINPEDLVAGDRNPRQISLGPERDLPPYVRKKSENWTSVRQGWFKGHPQGSVPVSADCFPPCTLLLQPAPPQRRRRPGLARPVPAPREAVSPSPAVSHKGSASAWLCVRPGPGGVGGPRVGGQQWLGGQSRAAAPGAQAETSARTRAS